MGKIARLRSLSTPVLFGLLVLGSICLAAESDSAQNPILRTSTHMVEVHVTVRDSHGPVAGLSKEDFLLTDQGKPQTISFFSAESKIPSPRAIDSLPPNTFSNLRKQSSVTAILVDGLNTKFEDRAYAKRQLLKFLKSVSPEDRIAVFTLERTLRVLSDFNRAGTVAQIVARSKTRIATEASDTETEPSNTGNDQLDEFIDHSNQVFASSVGVDRAQITLSAFAAISNHFASLPGRKTLIWLTGSLPFSIAGAARALNRADIALYPVDARGLVGVPNQMTAVAQGSNKPGRNPRVPSFRPLGLDTMQELADLTGGRAFYDTNDLTAAMRTALQDAEVSYTLGFYPGSEMLDGKLHALKVRTRASGMTALYRRSYFAARDRPPSMEVSLEGVLAAVWSPLESSAIPLRASMERIQKGQREYIKIASTVDVSKLQLIEDGNQWSGAINVFYFQQDIAGKELDAAQEAFDLRFTRPVYDGYRKSGMTMTKLVEPKAGLAILRVVLVDRSLGSVGSLIVPVSEVR